MTTPSNTQTLTSVGRLGGPIERLLVELALSVLIVLSHFTSECSKILPMSVSSKPAGVLAAAYTAATLVSVSIYCFRSKLRLKHKVLVDEREKHRVSMRRSKKVVLFFLILPSVVRILFRNRSIQSGSRFLSNQPHVRVFKQHLQFSREGNVE